MSSFVLNFLVLPQLAHLSIRGGGASGSSVHTLTSTCRGSCRDQLLIDYLALQTRFDGCWRHYFGNFYGIRIGTPRDSILYKRA